MAEMEEQFRNYQEKTDKSIDGLKTEIQETKRLMLTEMRSMMAGFFKEKTKENSSGGKELQ